MKVDEFLTQRFNQEIEEKKQTGKALLASEEKRCIERTEKIIAEFKILKRQLNTENDNLVSILLLSSKISQILENL